MAGLPHDLVDALHTSRDALDDASVLLGLHQVGVFDALTDGPRGLADLAEATGCVPGRLQAFLDLLVHRGLLGRVAGDYGLTGGPRRRPGLPRTPVAELFAAKGRSPDILQGGEPLAPPGSGGQGDPAARERFLRYLDGVSRDAAAAVASVLPTKLGHVVDLGSGAGTYTHALLARDPTATATLVDRPECGPVVLALAAERGVGDRLDFAGLDLLTDPLPAADTVLMSNLVHCYDPDTNRALIARAADVLRPGGRLIIKDYAVAADRSGPPAALRFAVSMALTTAGGGVYPAEQVADWCADAGLTPTVTSALAGISGSYLITAER